MEPTTDNFAFMFLGPEDEAAPFITQALEKLRHPSTSDKFCISYFVSYLRAMVMISQL